MSGIDSYKQLIMRLALCSRGVINPMCSLLGGVVAQEVLKAASGTLHVLPIILAMQLIWRCHRKIYAHQSMDVL